MAVVVEQLGTIDLADDTSSAQHTEGVIDASLVVLQSLPLLF